MKSEHLLTPCGSDTRAWTTLPPHGLQHARPPCSSSSKVFPNTIRKDKFKINHRPKCKTRNYQTLRGKHRQNTLWHKSQQDLLWPTSQSNRNKGKNKQLGPSQGVGLSHVWLFATPMDCSPPGSSIHGILQARILEWVAITSSRGSSQPRDQTHVPCISCIGRQILYHWAPWKAH